MTLFSTVIEAILLDGDLDAKVWADVSVQLASLQQSVREYVAGLDSRASTEAQHFFTALAAAIDAKQRLALDDAPSMQEFVLFSAYVLMGYRPQSVSPSKSLAYLAGLQAKAIQMDGDPPHPASITIFAALANALMKISGDPTHAIEAMALVGRLQPSYGEPAQYLMAMSNHLMTSRALARARPAQAESYLLDGVTTGQADLRCVGGRPVASAVAAARDRRVCSEMVGTDTAGFDRNRPRAASCLRGRGLARPRVLLAGRRCAGRSGP